jgi:hypothetical protein
LTKNSESSPTGSKMVAAKGLEISLGINRKCLPMKVEFAE